MEIITDSQLASYLGTAVTSGLTLTVELTNELIEESWTNPTEAPYPARVRALALTIAARAAANPKGLTSWTRQFDDVMRTERMEGGEARQGVYITDEEIAELNGAPAVPYAVGTIHSKYKGEDCRPC